MAVGSILGNGISGLIAFQQALATTGHNISNANTEGYSVQRASLTARTPQGSANGFVGSGVEVSTVRRLTNQFVDGQLRAATSAMEGFDALHELASRVDRLLGDSTTGISAAVDGFFEALEGVAGDPTSNAAREVLLGSAENLQTRFGFLDQSLSELENQINAELRNQTAEINSLTQAIADTNRAIVVAEGQTGQPPNDLLDRRDQLILQLAERIDISTVVGNDGQVTMSIGEGQVLVVGAEARPLGVVADPYNPTRAEIAFSDGNPISDSINGGRVGGLLSFREQVLDPAYNGLGRVATGLADTVNAQHQLGLDLEGRPGEDLFVAAQPQALAHVNNSGSGSPAVSIVDVGAVTTDDYLLRYDGSAWQLTNQRSGQVVSLSGSGTDADPFLAEGLSISVQSLGAGVGDDFRFIIQPTRNGARDFAVNLNDPARIAAASPIRAAVPSSNLGSARLELSGLTNDDAMPLSANGGDISLSFDPDALGAGVPGFVVSGGPGGTLAYDPATESGGKTFTLAAPFDGFSFTVSGAPQDGDSLTVTDNGNGVGDNRNALALGGLRQALTLAGGRSTYLDAYTQLVSDVAIKTNQADINRETQSGMLELSIAARESASGVNLDEEAANLLRFQQAYQAAARVIATADTLFQELIGAVRG